MATLKSITRWTAMAGMMVVVLVALAGCDVYSSGGWGSGYYSFWQESPAQWQQFSKWWGCMS